MYDKKDEVFVNYACSCGEIENPLQNLYHCHQCQKLRCKRCVAYEVEAFFCPVCLANVPTAEARIYGNRCSKCCQCPKCLSGLSLYATAEKEYYFSCGFCFWSSFDIDLVEDRPDKLVAHCVDLEKTSCGSKAMAEMIQHYKDVSIDQNPDPKNKYSTKSGLAYTSLAFASKFASSKYTNPIKRNTEPTQSDLCTTKDPYWERNIDECLESEQLESLLAYSDAKTIGKPLRTHLKSRLSVRCRDCDHKLVMSELNASSTKFKMKLVALSIIPKFTVRDLPKLQTNHTSNVLLTITNPLENDVDLSLKIMECTNGKTTLSTGEIQIGMFNEMADLLEEASDTDKYHDDPDDIPWRKANKLGIYMNVTPSQETSNYQVILQFSVTTKADQNSNSSIKEFQIYFQLGKVLEIE